MRAVLIDDWAVLRTLEGEWNALLRRSRSNTVFLTWEWMQAWLDVAGSRCEPLAVALTDAGGRLRGVAPFYVARYALFGTVPFRMLRVVADEATGSEYPAWIVDRDCEPEAERAIAAALCGAAARWDGVWMPNVAARTADGLTRACGAAGWVVRQRPQQFFSIDLPDSLPAYEASLTGNQRQQIRRKARKLNGGTYDIVRCETGTEVDAFLDALFELHGLRWRQRGETGSFQRNPALQRFYRRFVPVALNRGWLRLYALRRGGAFLALQLGYLYDGVFYQIQEGFDPATPDAGNVLRHHVIAQCIAEGARSYDFMAGAAPHKQRWGSATVTGCDLFMGRPGLLPGLVLAGGLWPTGRFLKPAEPRRAASPARAAVEPFR